MNSEKLMKTTPWIIVFLVSGVLVLGGCSKPPPPAPPAVQGVTVDLPKLKAAFATAGPECQSALSEVAQRFRYGEYSTSIAVLARLDSAPGVTEAQKKVVAEVAEQIRQVASKAAAPPAR